MQHERALKRETTAYLGSTGAAVVDEARVMVSLLRVMAGGEHALGERDRRNLARIGFIDVKPGTMSKAVLAFIAERPHLGTWLEALPQMLRDAANTKAAGSAHLMGHECHVLPVGARPLGAGQSRGGALARLTLGL